MQIVGKIVLSECKKWARNCNRLISGRKTAIASLIGKTHMNLKKIPVRGVRKSRFFRSARCKTYAQNQNLQTSAYLYECRPIFAPLCDTFCPPKPYQKHVENEVRKKLRKRGVPGETGVDGIGKRGATGGGLRGGHQSGNLKHRTPLKGARRIYRQTLRDTAAPCDMEVFVRGGLRICV